MINIQLTESWGKNDNVRVRNFGRGDAWIPGKIVHLRQLKGLSPADIEIMLEALVLTMKLQKRRGAR